MDRNLSKLQATVEDRGAWHAAVHGVAESDMPEQLNNNKGLPAASRPLRAHGGRNEWVEHVELQGR